MSKKGNEFKRIADLADHYRKMPDDQLLKIRQGYSPNWDVKYKKALNIVLKERGLKSDNWIGYLLLGGLALYNLGCTIWRKFFAANHV